MKIGFVRVVHEYVVDLDDPDAVRRARQLLKSDLCQMAAHPEREANLDNAIGVVEVSEEQESDIHEYVEEEGTVEEQQFYLTKDPLQYIIDSGNYESRGEDLWLDPGNHMVSTDDAIEMERMTLLGDSIRRIQGR